MRYKDDKPAVKYHLLIPEHSNSFINCTVIGFIIKKKDKTNQNSGNYKPFFTSLNVIQLRLRRRIIFQRRSFRSNCWLGWGSELRRRLWCSGRLLFYSGLDLAAALCSEKTTRDIRQFCATTFSFFNILVLMHHLWLPFVQISTLFYKDKQQNTAFCRQHLLSITNKHIQLYCNTLTKCIFKSRCGSVVPNSLLDEQWRL